MKTAILLLALVSAASHAQRQSEFAYGLAIDTPPGIAFARVAIPAAVYEGAAHRDLADMRVFNADGEVVPYAFVPRTSESVPLAEVPLRMFPLYVSRERGDVDGLALSVVRNAGGTTINVTSRDRGCLAAADARRLRARRERSRRSHRGADVRSAGGIRHDVDAHAHRRERRPRELAQSPPRCDPRAARARRPAPRAQSRGDHADEGQVHSRVVDARSPDHRVHRRHGAVRQPTGRAATRMANGDRLARPRPRRRVPIRPGRGVPGRSHRRRPRGAELDRARHRARAERGGRAVAGRGNDGVLPDRATARDTGHHRRASRHARGRYDEPAVRRRRPCAPLLDAAPGSARGSDRA